MTFGVNKGLGNLPYLRKIGCEINRRRLEVERVSHNGGLSGDSIQRVVQPTVTEDGEKAPSLKFGQPRVMALLLALTLFQHLIDGFHNRDLRGFVVDLLGVTTEQYTAGQMTYNLRRLRLKGLIFRPLRTNRYFVTPYGWKVARLFSRLEARVFRPAVATFTDAVLPFPLRRALDRVDSQLDRLIYDAFRFPLRLASDPVPASDDEKPTGANVSDDQPPCQKIPVISGRITSPPGQSSELSAGSSPGPFNRKWSLAQTAPFGSSSAGPAASITRIETNRGAAGPLSSRRRRISSLGTECRGRANRWPHCRHPLRGAGDHPGACGPASQEIHWQRTLEKLAGG